MAVDREAARRNRDLFPETAKIVDAYRELFGPGVKLICAVEGERRIGHGQHIEDMQRLAEESRRAQAERNRD
jgi:hypothetical protein